MKSRKYSGTLELHAMTQNIKNIKSKDFERQHHIKTQHFGKDKRV